jgi:hypothetical protein
MLIMEWRRKERYRQGARFSRSEAYFLRRPQRHEMKRNAANGLLYGGISH